MFLPEPRSPKQPKNNRNMQYRETTPQTTVHYNLYQGTNKGHRPLYLYHRGLIAAILSVSVYLSTSTLHRAIESWSALHVGFRADVKVHGVALVLDRVQRPELKAVGVVG